MLWKQQLIANDLLCPPSAGHHYIHIIFSQTALGMQNKCCGINAVPHHCSTPFKQ